MRAIYNSKGEIIAAEPDTCPDCHRSHCVCCAHGVPPGEKCDDCAWLDEENGVCPECWEDWEDCNCEY